MRRFLWIFFAVALLGAPNAWPQETDDGEIIYALAELESLFMRRLDEATERGGTIPDDDPTDDRGDTIWFTNACGKAIATFSITRSTKPLPETLEYKTSIGEWCEPPFDFSKAHENHFLIIKDGEIKAVVVTLWSVAREHVLPVHQRTIDSWTNKLGRLHPSLVLAGLKQPVQVYFASDTEAPSIIAFVAEQADLDFFYSENSTPYLQKGEKYIGLTKGVYLETLFPEVEYDGPILVEPALPDER